MAHNYFSAYLGILCPVKFPVETYKLLTKEIFNGRTLDNAEFNLPKDKGVFVVKDGRLLVSKEHAPAVLDEFINLPAADQSKFFNGLTESIEKYFGNSNCYGTISAYLSLNFLSLNFYAEYKKQSPADRFKTVYDGFKKLNDKADSLCFRSIILCNCLILEMLTYKNDEIIAVYRNRLKLIKENTDDEKITEKIEKFINFDPLRDNFIPVWIVGATDY